MKDINFNHKNLLVDNDVNAKYMIVKLLNIY